MSTLKALRVAGLRSLKDTGFIDLRPVTMLVGRNSSGKSTFARVFPLLRQSVEEKKRAPILWYGSYVDFGTFQDAMQRASSGTIEFGFKLELEGPAADDFVDETQSDSTVNLEVTIVLRADSDGGTRLAKVTGQYDNIPFCLAFTSDEKVESTTVGSIVWKPDSRERQRISYRSVLPQVDFLRLTRFEGSGEVEPQEGYIPYEPFLAIIRSEIRRYVHGNAGEETIDHIAKHLSLGPLGTFVASVRKIPAAPESWRASTQLLSQQSSGLIRLREALLAKELSGLLRQADDILASHFSGVRYIEPLRATAQRYYRRQELAIDDIDSKGANIPFYLDSLSARERTNFDTWMREYFGVAVSAHREGGHITLKLTDENDSTPTNLADIGFGFSQVLPFAVQLWAATRGPIRRLVRFRRRGISSIVIEQPELHLHPAFQAKISDVIVASLGETVTPVRRVPVILETHSSAIVNRFGRAIARRDIRAQDVQVLLFERDPATGLTKVRPVDFDGEGVLQAWPYGFFEPDD